jgi:hypothetical protein
MVDWWLDDPTATYIKVVDTKTGKFEAAFRIKRTLVSLVLFSRSVEIVS